MRGNWLVVLCVTVNLLRRVASNVDLQFPLTNRFVIVEDGFDGSAVRSQSEKEIPKERMEIMMQSEGNNDYITMLRLLLL